MTTDDPLNPTDDQLRRAVVERLSGKTSTPLDPRIEAIIERVLYRELKAREAEQPRPKRRPVRYMTRAQIAARLH